jgi:hypothetical protein
MLSHGARTINNSVRIITNALNYFSFGGIHSVVHPFVIANWNESKRYSYNCDDSLAIDDAAICSVTTQPAELPDISSCYYTRV